MQESTAHLWLWFDPEERRGHRIMQAAQMGRYMHQNVFQWAGVDVEVFQRYYQALKEIIDNEGPLEFAAENQT